MKIEIGKLIEIVDERNTDASINTFYGININKEFMPTVANTDGIDCKKYKVVRKNRFVFSGMQTGRDECIRIGLFTEDDPIIISPAYTTFEITRSDLVLNKYFFMRFLSKEMDRYGSFLSDSSIRSNLDWERFCEIEIDLPSIIVQKKYVDVYNSLLQNQKVYEKGLDDLKLTCDAYIENLRHDVTAVTIGDYIKESDERNTALKYDINAVKGITTEKQFIETKANMEDVKLNSYKIVNPK
ncbi:MAG: restriction endonuclease subunit S, partial [Treponema sp.]|nr:restriction endonuclease subunit S [Treponema sp.]